MYQPPRLTQPSTPRGAVKWVSAFGLSNNNKWRWWIRFTGCLYRRACGSTQTAWSKGRRPPGAVSVFITWTEWTLAMTLPWWQHYKYHRGYYYYYYYYYYRPGPPPRNATVALATPLGPRRFFRSESSSSSQRDLWWSWWCSLEMTINASQTRDHVHHLSLWSPESAQHSHRRCTNRLNCYTFKCYLLTISILYLLSLTRNRPWQTQCIKVGSGHFTYRRLRGNQNRSGLQCEVAYWPALAVGSAAQIAAIHCQ